MNKSAHGYDPSMPLAPIYSRTHMIRAHFAFRSALLATALLIASHAFAGGRIDFATGPVSAVNAKGESRGLERGQRIEQGDTVVTGSGGELHIVMDDHALIALRPNTRMVVEEYVADGGKDDRSLLRLARGAMRSVTGWIGKTSPRNYEIRTATATIGIRGTDHEVGVLNEGDNAGTYDKVNEGETALRNPAGEVNVRPGLAAFVPQGKPVAPRVLDSVPAFYKPTANENRIEDTKGKLSREMDDRLDARRKEKRAAEGAPSACGPNSPAMLALQEFIRAYENGDVGLLQTKLNPAMPGYQRFLDGLMRDFATQKQIRIFVKDIQAQCGPDVTNLVMTWEKRFLDLVTFQPGYFSGQVSILMHRDGTGWRPGAFAGDNPFSRASGVLARFTFGPAFSLAAVNAQPSPQPVTIEVVDADIAGQGSLNLQVATSAGDVETVTLSETTPGRFVRTTLNVSSQPTAPGNGVIEVANGVQIAARYVDQQPGNNLPATVLTRSITPAGQLPVNADTVPNPFSFPPVTQAVAGSTVSSTPANINGINAATPINIVGGAYSINNGPFTSAPGSITNNQNVVVRVVASSVSGGTSMATLNVGGVSGTFVVTTATVAPDTTPDPFSFSPAFGAPLSTPMASNLVTITGINAPTMVSVSGGEYAIGGGAFTAAAGTVNNNQTLQLRGVSAGTNNTTTNVIVTVGGYTASFSIMTAGAGPDTTPDPFGFTPVTNAALSSTHTSNTIAITGIDSPTPVSIMGGLVSINGGPFGAAAGTITNGQTLTVRATAGAAFGTTTMANVNVGGVIGTFSISTIPADTTPDPFSFTPRTMAQPSTTFPSNAITITGINSAAPISITSGNYSINGGAFTSAPGSINNGDTLQLQGTSSAITDGSGVVNVTANVGGVMGNYSITTRDTTPNPFSFPNSNVLNSVCGVTGPGTSSATVTITGVDSPAPITVTAGTYSVNGGPFVASGGTILSGQTLQLRRAGMPANSTTSMTVTIGQGGPNPGTSATWTITCS
jgi:hypothetical protein